MGQQYQQVDEGTAVEVGRQEEVVMLGARKTCHSNYLPDVERRMQIPEKKMLIAEMMGHSEIHRTLGQWTQDRKVAASFYTAAERSKKLGRDYGASWATL